MSKRNSLDHTVMMYGSAPFIDDEETKDAEEIARRISIGTSGSFSPFPDFHEKQKPTTSNEEQIYNKLVMGVLSLLPSYTLMPKIGGGNQKTAAEMITLIRTNQIEGMQFVMNCMAKGLSF